MSGARSFNTLAWDVGARHLRAMMPRIRDGRPQDAEAVEFVHFASREAAYRDRVPGWPVDVLSRTERVELWRAWLGDREVTTLVLEAEDGIVGICTMRPSEDPDADPSEVVEIPTLYIRPGAWRRGYGLALCREACRRGQAQGFRWLTLWVLDLNVEARRFYATLGFREDGVTRIDPSHTVEPLQASRYRLDLEAGIDELRDDAAHGNVG